MIGRRLGAVLAAALTLIVGAGAVAAAPPIADHGATHALTLQAGTGVLLHLATPMASVLSADPDIAKVQPASPTSLFLMGVAPGQTTVIATNQAGSAIAEYDIRVLRGAGTSGGGGGGGGGPPAPAARIEGAILSGVPGAGAIRVSMQGGSVLLSGAAPDALIAAQAVAIARAYLAGKSPILDQITVLESLQVNVRVRIAEIDRQITRQLGFNWQALGSGTNWSFGLRTGAAAAGGISALLPLGLTPLANATTPYQLGGGYASKLWDVNNVIDALAADQLVTILAEPNLTARSGETASFLAGGEFPIPVAGAAQNGTVQITVDFKQYGVSLTLVPTVLSPDRLNLRIRPEVSQLTSAGAINIPLAGGTLTIPALTVRRAETTVELGSGQSFAIAGLLQKNSISNTNALPGLGELPVLGALFKSNDFQRGESELVIIVTPYIVRPVANPGLLRAPTDHFRPATDLARILFGDQMQPVGESVQDAGFILK